MKQDNSLAKHEATLHDSQVTDSIQFSVLTPEKCLPINERTHNPPFTRLIQKTSVAPELDEALKGSVRCAAKVEEDVRASLNFKGIESSPRVFPNRFVSSQRPPVGTCNRVLRQLQRSEIENNDLRQKHEVISEENEKTEKAMQELRKENRDLNEKLGEQVEWIKEQMEKNYSVVGKLQEVKELAMNYDKQFSLMKATLEHLDQHICQELKTKRNEVAYEYNCLSKLEEVEKNLKEIIRLYEDNTEIGIDRFLEEIIGYLNKEGCLKSRQTDESFLCNNMKLKIKRLEDELKIANKWKTMYSNLLTESYNPNNMLMMQEHATNKDANIKENVPAEYSKELSKLFAENAQLKEKVEGLEEELSSIRRSPLISQKDADKIVEKVALLLLRKYTEDTFQEGDLKQIKSLFGNKIIQTLEEHKSDAREDCKTLCSILNSLVLLL
eukprot:TRINITY_DN1554_c0_g2_i4.p1 TRINITY_DN1554_c0_g2~~TRINITY_DN1554_c0_g2_i4.p1  ORF type:complete len:440 (+),score=115.71 TRINITY_DN1554_c0_g2_i4:224-1543(+)